MNEVYDFFEIVKECKDKKTNPTLKFQRHSILNNQPERSKREDFDGLAEEFLSIPVDDRGGNWETENGYILGVEAFAKFLNQRCGALNIVETQ